MDNEWWYLIGEKKGLEKMILRAKSKEVLEDLGTVLGTRLGWKNLRVIQGVVFRTVQEEKGRMQ